VSCCVVLCCVVSAPRIYGTIANSALTWLRILNNSNSTYISNAADFE
jgi:hypothetical protein